VNETMLTFDRFTTDPAVLAGEIEQALRHYGLRKAEKTFPYLTFREGELEMIAQALRAFATRRQSRARSG
jgi:hypothetical protein